MSFFLIKTFPIIILILYYLIQLTYQIKCSCSQLVNPFDCVSASCLWNQYFQKCEIPQCQNQTQIDCTFTQQKTRDPHQLCYWKWTEKIALGQCNIFTKCEDIKFSNSTEALQKCIDVKNLKKLCKYKEGDSCSSPDEDEQSNESYTCSQFNDDREICNIAIEGERECYHNSNECTYLPESLKDCGNLLDPIVCRLSDNCVWNEDKCQLKACERQNPCKSFVLEDSVKFCVEDKDKKCIPGQAQNLTLDNCGLDTEFNYFWNQDSKECEECEDNSEEEEKK